MNENSGKIDSEENEGLPDCFGDLGTVFPMGEDGLRESPARCMDCPCKTICLKRALAGDGGRVEATERLKRHHEGGSIGFAGRWSRKKALERTRPEPEAGSFWKRIVNRLVKG